jgi:hypothetical protein
MGSNPGQDRRVFGIYIICIHCILHMYIFYNVYILYIVRLFYLDNFLVIIFIVSVLIPGNKVNVRVANFLDLEYFNGVAWKYF